MSAKRNGKGTPEYTGSGMEITGLKPGFSYMIPLWLLASPSLLHFSFLIFKMEIIPTSWGCLED